MQFNSICTIKKARVLSLLSLCPLSTRRVLWSWQEELGIWFLYTALRLLFLFFRLLWLFHASSLVLCACHQSGEGCWLKLVVFLISLQGLYNFLHESDAPLVPLHLLLEGLKAFLAAGFDIIETFRELICPSNLCISSSAGVAGTSS